MIWRAAGSFCCGADGVDDAMLRRSRSRRDVSTAVMQTLVIHAPRLGGTALPIRRPADETLRLQNWQSQYMFAGGQ